jgi:hypothetical protein
MWKTVKFRVVFAMIAVIQILFKLIGFLAPMTTSYYLERFLPLAYYWYFFIDIPSLYLFLIIALITGFQGISLGGLWLVILSVPFILIYSFIFTKIVLWAWGKFSKQ